MIGGHFFQIRWVKNHPSRHLNTESSKGQICIGWSKIFRELAIIHPEENFSHDKDKSFSYFLALRWPVTVEIKSSWYILGQNILLWRCAVRDHINIKAIWHHLIASSGGIVTSDPGLWTSHWSSPLWCCGAQSDLTNGSLTSLKLISRATPGTQAGLSHLNSKIWTSWLSENIDRSLISASGWINIDRASGVRQHIYLSGKEWAF